MIHSNKNTCNAGSTIKFISAEIVKEISTFLKKLTCYVYILLLIFNFRNKDLLKQVWLKTFFQFFYNRFSLPAGQLFPGYYRLMLTVCK